MGQKKLWKAQVDAAGRLILPPEAIEYFGLRPGVEVQVQQDENEMRLLRPVTHLGRVYIEATNNCNLECRTCMRKVWDETSGYMEADTFERILSGLAAFSPPPGVFFGGFGEPLSHSGIVEMVRRVKKLGAPVELITNGVLLQRDLSQRLVEAGLDVLWVSIDGATAESYADVRLGDLLPEVLKNLYDLRSLQYRRYKQPVIQVGIAFVAMRRNIADLPKVISLGNRLGVSRYSITNVLAHTPELKNEVLYGRALHHTGYLSIDSLPRVDLPRIDFDAQTQAVLGEVLGGISHAVRLAGYDTLRAADSCPFIEKGSLAIRWDGAVSPCLPLLHTHTGYLENRQRLTHAHVVGNLLEQSLKEIWEDESYLAFRRRVQAFDFSPCVYCNSCEFPEQNLEDCYGNQHPACGGCLWAQGLIRCP